MTADNLTALPEPVCHLLIVRESGRVVGQLPNKCAGMPDPDGILAGFDEVPAYTEQQVRALLAARDAERADDARYRWLRDSARDADILQLAHTAAQEWDRLVDHEIARDSGHHTTAPECWCNPTPHDSDPTIWEHHDKAERS